MFSNTYRFCLLETFTLGNVFASSFHIENLDINEVYCRLLAQWFEYATRLIKLPGWKVKALQNGYHFITIAGAVVTETLWESKTKQIAQICIVAQSIQALRNADWHMEWGYLQIFNGLVTLSYLIQTSVNLRLISNASGRK